MAPTPHKRSFEGRPSSTGSRLDLLSPNRSVLRPFLADTGAFSPIISDREMSAYLDEVLARAIASREPPNEVSLPTSPTLKWRYSSAFQKAVRRNDQSIGTVAAALNSCDPEYIWRRAPTIALEDVSLGDPWVVALVLHACRFSKLRANYGPGRLAAFLGELMGSAVKDRLTCDSFCLPYFHPKLARARSKVGRMSVSERADLYRSDETALGLRISAGVALAGPRYGGGIFGGQGGSADELASVVQDLAPFLIQWISRQYANMAKDGMFVTLPVVWRQLSSEGQIDIAHGKLPERRLIGGILSAAFDGHTREGRNAISHFGRTCGPIVEVLRGVSDKQKALELAVFTIDSSLLDRRLLCPWSEALYRKNLEGEVLAAGLSLRQFDELAASTLENREMLNLARSIAAK